MKLTSIIIAVGLSIVFIDILSVIIEERERNKNR